MADNALRHGSVPQITGPYENWLFNAGSAYSGSDPQSSFITALAELPKGHKLLKSKVVLPIGKNGNIPAYTPTLWNGDPNPPAWASTQFAPVIVKKPKVGPRENVFDKIRDALQNIVDLAIMGAPKPAREIGFRLNNPISQANFDEDFWKNPFKPILNPDQKIQTRLGRLPPKKPGLPAAAPLAIVAVIDDQLPFAHRNTLSSDGSMRSRMEFCWLQSADIAETAPERTVLFGREHTRHSIERLLKLYPGDEDSLYRAASSHASHGESKQAVHGLWSHGAAVLDIAAGHSHPDEPSARPVIEPDGDLDRIRLIGVELPAPDLLDTVGFGKDCYILSAFHYIFDRADKIRDAYGLNSIPLVINLSFGFSGGPHSGMDRLEQAISHLIVQRNLLAPTRLVMPSGNNFLENMNGEIRAKDLDLADSFSIPWRIQPNDRTSSYLEIWYPSSKLSKKPDKPSITGPEGLEIALVEQKPIRNSPTIWSMELDRKPIGQVSLDRFRGISWRILVVVAPTEFHEKDLPVAPAGLWHIKIKAPELKKTGNVIHCRIQRDSSPIAPTKGGRQSYFDDPQGETFELNDDGTPRTNDLNSVFVRRFGTINGLATHAAVVVVGGFNRSAKRASRYSSAGGVGKNPGSPGTVTCSAVSDESPLLPGQNAAGTRMGTVARLLGTSGSAPHIARGIGIGVLEPKTPIIVANIPIKGLVRYPLPLGKPDLKDQSETSVLRLGRGLLQSNSNE